MTIHKNRLQRALGSLGMKYPALSKADSMNVDTPDAMGFETKEALKKLNHAVGNVDVYVMSKLKYNNLDELYGALKAEQIDAVGLAIYNIEYKNEGIIVADQTGIGKGRIAASMIRYAVKNGKTPIFFTEKPNLFSDLYRDLIDINSGDIKPFIVNAKDSKSDIKDKNGKLLYQALEYNQQKQVFTKDALPKGYDAVLLTYSQINSGEFTSKKGFVKTLSNGAIIILDEAHNASGMSSTGEFVAECVLRAKGVTFLSATFAKRPDNMALYALKTCLGETGMTNEELISAFDKGGVALQEVVASQLAAQGQLIRRERLYDGIEINYINLEQNEKRDSQIADSLTDIVRDIIAFQRAFVLEALENVNKSMSKSQSSAKVTKGTKDSGVDVIPVFSRLFNIVNQMLFSLKADDVAERAIMRLKQGKKPVIAFASTMGSFLENMDDEDGVAVKDGSVIDANYNLVLLKALKKSMQYTVKNSKNLKSVEYLEVSQLDFEGQQAYMAIVDKINRLNTGLSISPIDYIKQKIEAAGYKVGEVTGRKYEVILQSSKLFRKPSLGEKSEVRPLTNGFTGIVKNRKKEATNDLFRQFNDNELDVLMINQSGSTGASAHAIPTSKVPANQVKQRVMIVLQAELDINTEVQKRGRINRTGQILLPIYDYLISSIPAEKRLMMMLQKKLKSLDANTSANQKNSKALLQSVDFLNKYGNKLIVTYLLEHESLNEKLDDPLFLYDSTKQTPADAASKVSGRVAVLPVELQKKFYDEFIPMYQDYIEQLIEEDKYDLETETLDLKAKTLEISINEIGRGGNSPFGGNVYTEYCEVDNLRKPYTTREIDTEIKKGLDGNNPIAQSEALVNKVIEGIENQRLKDRLEATEKINGKIKNIKTKKGYKDAETAELKQKFIENETESLNERLVNNLAKIDSEAYQEKTFIIDLMKFFKVGMKLNIPTGIAGENLLGTFLGFTFKKNSQKPFKASQIGCSFGVAASRRRITLSSLVGDNSQRILAIKGASSPMPSNYSYVADLLPKWEETIKFKISNRTNRFILTGNIIKVASKGRLIDYTTVSGKIKKGVLVYEENDSSKKGDKKPITTTVPIKYCLKAINSMIANVTLTCNKGISMIRKSDYTGILLYVPKSDKYIITNEKLLKVIEGQEFIIRNNSAVGTIKSENTQTLITILSDEFDIKANLSENQLQTIKDDLPEVSENYEKLPPVIFDPAKVVMTYPNKPKVTETSKKATETSKSISDKTKLALKYKYKALAQKQELELLELLNLK